MLLHWFAQGLVTGVGQAAGEQVEPKAAGAVKKLGTRVMQLFGRHQTTPEADTAVEKELASETQAALTKAQQALAAGSADEVTRVAEAYEQVLVGYLTDNGMPGRDAARIAQRVRTEAGS